MLPKPDASIPDPETQALILKASGLPLETRATHQLSLLKPWPQVEGQRHAKAAATALLEQKLCWLTLTGDCGTGKSHIAIGIGWAWLERGRGCRYAVVSALLDRLRATYDVSPQQAFQLNQPDFERVFGWYCDIPLLILDDLGMEKRTEWGLEKLDYLFDYRYLRSLPLVVATNEVIDKLPPRIQDRLMDKRLGRVVVLSGPSYRST